MELISIESFVFMVIAIVMVAILPKKAKDVGLAILTVCVLYTSNSTTNFISSLAILVAVYLAGRLMEQVKYVRPICYTTVILLVVGLMVWKYANFFISTINKITNLFVGQQFLSTVEIRAPFGISYGFLILIAYILGIYWGQLQSPKNIFTYTHTVAFFPLWCMGPILGADDLKEENHLCVTYDSFCRGAQRILWGLFKKLVISERCGIIVDEVFDNPMMYTGLYEVIATLLFVLQLYTDFSGAMDMVLGFAEIIGKKLPENFDHPFSSTSVSEFWRRWHITLGAWLKNFVLYPILKSRLFQAYGDKLKKKFKKKTAKRIVTYTGLFISWFLIGLWHGGGWNYIFGVGIYFWILIVASELAQPLFAKICTGLKINKDCWSYQSFAKIRTTLLVSFGLMFFRAGSMSNAITFLKSMLRIFNPWILFNDSLLDLGLDAKSMNILVLGLLLLFVVSCVQKKIQVRDWLAKQNLAFRWIVLLGLLFAIIIFGCYGMEYDATSFIYFQF